MFCNEPGTFPIFDPNAWLHSKTEGRLRLSETGVFDGEFCLSSAPSSTLGFSTDPPIAKVSNVFGEKSFNPRSENNIYIQMWSFPEVFDMIQVWYLIATGIHNLCSSSRKNFLPHFMHSLMVKRGWDRN